MLVECCYGPLVSADRGFARRERFRVLAVSETITDEHLGVMHAELDEFGYPADIQAPGPVHTGKGIAASGM